MMLARKLAKEHRWLAGIAAGSVVSLMLAACATSNDGAPPEDEVRTILDAGGDVLGASDSAPDAEAPPVPCAVGNLCRVPTPMRYGSITSLSGRSKNDVWASASGATLMHWDGQAWRTIDTGIYDTLSSLFVTPDEVWGISGDLLWRRGDASGIAKSFRVRVLGYSAWRSLSGVAVLSNSDVYVSMLPSKTQTEALQPLAKVADFDAQKLEFPPDPVYAPTQRVQPSSVEALFLVPDKTLWLVGDRGVVIRYRLSASGLETGETFPVPSQESLLGAWGQDDHLWAVGTSGTILHFDGASWMAESSGTTATLEAVFGFGANDIWVAGDRGTVLHYDGTTWSQLPIANDEGMLTSIWGASSTDVWIGGENAMLHWGALP